MRKTILAGLGLTNMRARNSEEPLGPPPPFFLGTFVRTPSVDPLVYHVLDVHPPESSEYRLCRDSHASSI